LDFISNYEAKPYSLFRGRLILFEDVSHQRHRELWELFLRMYSAYSVILIFLFVFASVS